MSDSTTTPNPQRSDNEYDLVLKEEVIFLKGKDGVKHKHFLRELTGPGREEWLDFVNSRSKTDATGKAVGLSSFQGLHAFLITRTLFTADNVALSEEDLTLWPSTTTKNIYQRSRVLSGLDEKAEETAKNG